MYKPNTFNQSQNTKKIQFNHFSAYPNFTDLLITPKNTPRNNSTPVPIKGWHFQ